MVDERELYVCLVQVCLYFNIFIENYQAAVVNNVGGLTLNIRIMTSFANLSSFHAFCDKVTGHSRDSWL